MLVIFSIIVAVIIVRVRGSEVGENLLPTRLLSRPVTCVSTKQRGLQDIWNEARTKYSHLADDKFTIAMLTYRRPQELNHTLTVLLEERIPSLYEIVVVWRDLKAELPMNFESKHGVPTQAILLTDDDVYYRPKDLEFVFQTWRKFGRDRLTGALARCSDINAEGNYNYNFCSRKDRDDYSMILTNLCFSHISFMDYYWSNDTTMSKIRDYVDEIFNCEDIALNYIQGLLTGQGPLPVNGRERYVNLNPPKGISTKPGHLEARSKCLNDFAKMFKCMPLVDETAHIQRGVIAM
ncbi:glycosyl transferase family 64 domain-containing protein [Fusarium solani]|uniref:Glycosyl transferase family 64 domain-containing protein n=1 Tax=Fusarium solani TaxID=169388 RepID=A0A9P9JLG7_FUSSL|nr:glycosyl transferase family 64 domain-containing protein [Fusarium solani]KAH7224249.1 glycosyl transferase family 64 domain-containing protein [Fusarium solani]